LSVRYFLLCGGGGAGYDPVTRPHNSMKGSESMNLLAPILLAVLAQPGTDPQKLFLSMEERITNATSVQITFEAKLESKKGDGAAKGTVAFAPKAKCRADLDLDVEGKKLKLLMVSDGTKMSASSDGQPGKVEPVPDFLASALVTMASKTGITGGLMFGVSRSGNGEKPTNPFKDLKTTNFKLGKVDMINGQRAQVVEYRMSIPGSEMNLDAAVWIDMKTNLPVKRQLVATVGGERMALTETYSEFRLNAKLDEKTFVLPK
jgi:outer membrane lipoprotein-sorting protein